MGHCLETEVTINETTVNWAQLSNEYRANEQAGDRAEWKWSPSGHVTMQDDDKQVKIGLLSH